MDPHTHTYIVYIYFRYTNNCQYNCWFKDLYTVLSGNWYRDKDIIRFVLLIFDLNFTWKLNGFPAKTERSMRARIAAYYNKRSYIKKKKKMCEV